MSHFSTASTSTGGAPSQECRCRAQGDHRPDTAYIRDSRETGIPRAAQHTADQRAGERHKENGRRIYIHQLVGQYAGAFLDVINADDRPLHRQQQRAHTTPMTA